jgi:branched-chain amino acid transport system substrate-binding protein
MIGALFDGVAHLDSVQATELAVKEVNDAGGLDGRDFAVVFCDYGEGFSDDLDSLEASEQGAVWLADELGATAIVGPRGSSRTEAAFLALGERDVVLISPSATSPDLTAIDETEPTDENPGRLWRTAPPDGLQAEAIVADLDDRGVAAIAIIHQEGSYGDALAALIESGYADAVGGTVQVFPYASSPFGAVADAAASNPEEVVFISSDIADYVNFFDGAVASENLLNTYASLGIFLSDGAFNVQLLEGVSDEALVLFPNVRGTRYPPIEGPLFETFAAAFKTEYKADPQSSGFTVHTYDAAWLILYATAWAHHNESDQGGRSLGRGLRKVSEGPSISIRYSGWAEVLENFENGTSIDVRGGSGELDYDPATEETTANLELWIIEESSPGTWEFGDAP